MSHPYNGEADDWRTGCILLVMLIAAAIAIYLSQWVHIVVAILIVATVMGVLVYVGASIYYWAFYSWALRKFGKSADGDAGTPRPQAHDVFRPAEEQGSGRGTRMSPSSDSDQMFSDSGRAARWRLGWYAVLLVGASVFLFIAGSRPDMRAAGFTFFTFFTALLLAGASVFLFIAQYQADMRAGRRREWYRKLGAGFALFTGPLLAVASVFLFIAQYNPAISTWCARLTAWIPGHCGLLGFALPLFLSLFCMVLAFVLVVLGLVMLADDP
jgi:hypothetical protein